APVITGALTDPVAGTTVLTWSQPNGATSFQLQMFVNGVPSGAPVSASAPSYTFPDPLTPDADVAVAVAGVNQGAGVTITGPYSAPYPLPTEQPQLTSAGYDGSLAMVAWLPVIGATGYTASILASGASAPVAQALVSAAVTSATLTPTISDTAQTYSA